MPDFTMCTNKQCDLRHSCERYRATPNAFNQSYARFEPDWTDDVLDEIECKFYREFNPTASER